MVRSVLLSVAALAMLALVAPTASATTGGCFIPIYACEIYADSFFDGADLSSDPKICERQCREFRDACFKVCKQSKECIEVAVTGFFREEALTCNELDGSAKSECKSSVSEDTADFQEGLEQNRADCRECCEDTYLDCLDECTIS